MDRCVTVAVVVVAWALTARAGYVDEWARMKGLVPRGYVCFRATNAIVIDGRLTEPTWQAAPWTMDFVAIDGDSNRVVPVRARAKLLWDSTNLYVALVLEPAGPKLAAAAADVAGALRPEVWLLLDPDCDGHAYYEVVVSSSAGTQLRLLDKPPKDGGSVKPLASSSSLRAALGSSPASSRLPELERGWTFELAIDWQALLVATGEGSPEDRQHWRMNLAWMTHPSEKSRWAEPAGGAQIWVWSPHGVADLHRPERWGYLQFSRRRGSRARFIPDAALAARNALQELYYYQKDFYAQHGRWAVSLSELGYRFTPRPALDHAPVIRLTSEGFEASIDGPVQGLRPLRWHISHDGRFWADPELALQLRRYYQTVPDAGVEP